MKHRNTDIINAVKGKRTGINCIRTIAVLTPQNQDFRKSPTSINMRGNIDLAQDLKNGHYVYMPCIGKWERNQGNAYAVTNIPLDICKRYNGKHNQTGFVFCTLTGDGTLVCEYFEKTDSEFPYIRSYDDYVVKNSGLGYVDMDGYNDNLTIVGNSFKYQIPIKTISDINDTIADNFHKIPLLNKCSTILEEIDFCMNHIGMPSFIHKKNLYRGLLR